MTDFKMMSCAGQTTQTGDRYFMVANTGAPMRLMFYDLDGGAVINIRGSDSPCIDFAFNADHDKLMALRADDVIDVYDLKADELLFSMRSPERFTAFGFAEDGSCAAGLTASGALRAEMWTDEASLLAYAVSITGH